MRHKAERQKRKSKADLKIVPGARDAKHIIGKEHSEVHDMTTERKTSFITLYFPSDENFRRVFCERAESGVSVSGQILKLIAIDLAERKIITATEADKVSSFKFHPTTTNKDGTPKAVKTKRNNSNYSFYVPRDLWDITIDKLDANLKGAIPFKSRSKYIWSLFMGAYLPKQEHSQYLDKHAV